jgi:hypothetical protein
MSEFVTLKGELMWIRTKEPEEYNGKKSWKATIRPDQESVMKVMDLQAKGVKNQLKKDEHGYYINFSRPTEKKKKTGEVFRTYNPPQVTDRSGKVIDDMVANGAKGEMKLEFDRFKGQMGMIGVAMLDSLVLDEWQKYGAEAPSTATAEAY